MEPHFFQILDRIRYEAALNALTREGKSLALISPVQALAEHYKLCLLERLKRDLPVCEIKPFFPDDADAIVEKFNQVVADMPMAQALSPGHGTQGLKIWVVHDAGALPSSEALLLLQLLEKFPGAQVRAMLVYGGTQISPEGLESREKSVLRWVVERPSLEQIKECLAQEQDPERNDQLRDLIQRMAPPGSVPVKDKRQLAASGEGAPPPSDTAASSKKRRGLSRLLGLSALLVTLLAFSVLVAIWLNPQVVDDIPAYWGGTQVASPKADSDSQAPKPADPNNLLAHPLVKKMKELWLGKPVASQAEPEVAQGKAPEAAPVPAAGDAAAVATPPSADPAPGNSSPEKSEPGNSAPSQVASPGSEPAPKDKAANALLTELPDGAEQGERWAKGLEAGSWVIQHSISLTYAQAVEVQKKFSDLSDARIVPQFVAAEKQARFALISGPYGNRNQANEFIQSKRMPKDAWARTAKAMQDRLQMQSAKPAKP